MSIKFKLQPPPDGDTSQELLYKCEECERYFRISSLAAHAVITHNTRTFEVDTIPNWKNK